ncbi:hypothetical protein L1049_004075 [Liquidambar formosana]|uniref:Uncharacterized protein n=1 Tax=Liquidambar formosana TaxID=63359 RepID=A0AAP0RSM3_LIQFO
MESLPDFYPLTSLQIGDVKSYLSQAYLYFAPASQKFLILVDNQSWRMNKHSRSTRLWGLMITKYRKSPFRNTRTFLKSPSLRYKGSSNSSSHERKNLYKWLSGANINRWREKAPFSFLDLRKVLHGFIVFEVAWKDVRGINYLNELQTDTSIALEVKSMRKWEFNDINQALSCVSSWFSGTLSERQTLQSNLILLHNKVLSCSSWGLTVAPKELLFNDTFRAEILSEDVFFDVMECPVEATDKFTMEHQEEKHMDEKREQSVKEDTDIESMGYKDTLLLFQFNDKDLPFKLRKIITFDLRLLTLLESGLPSWVIFLQSYPLFCKVYHPWMRPLVRTLYMLISLTTLMIGFYDLYKNVPLLKATASHLCGPLFKWIEAWEMISRIRYLGTMLFLQNFEKAVKWSMMIMRLMKMLVSLLTKPLMGPLEEMIEFITPIWSIFVNTGGQLYDSAWVMVASLCSMVVYLVGVLLSPFELLYSYTVAFVCPIFNSMWELFLVPTQVCLLLANYMASLFYEIYDSLEKGLMMFASSMGRLKDIAQVKPNSSEISFWHSLWKDLFSKVFRSLRSIIRGLVAFFTSCNRHRLSIYNYLRAIFWQLCCFFRLARNGCPCQQAPRVESQLMVDLKECDRCK